MYENFLELFQINGGETPLFQVHFDLDLVQDCNQHSTGNGRTGSLPSHDRAKGEKTSSQSI